MLEEPTKFFYKLNDIIGDKNNNISPLIPISKTTWLSGVKTGKYPKPIHLSKRTVAWRSEDILSLIDQLNEQAL